MRIVIFALIIGAVFHGVSFGEDLDLSVWDGKIACTVEVKGVSPYDYRLKNYLVNALMKIQDVEIMRDRKDADVYIAFNVENRILNSNSVTRFLALSYVLERRGPGLVGKRFDKANDLLAHMASMYTCNFYHKALIVLPENLECQAEDLAAHLNLGVFDQMRSDFRLGKDAPLRGCSPPEVVYEAPGRRREVPGWTE